MKNSLSRAAFNYGYFCRTNLSLFREILSKLFVKSYRVCVTSCQHGKVARIQAPCLSQILIIKIAKYKIN